MRIRKHASRTLTSISPPLPSSPASAASSPTSSVAAAVAGDYSSSALRVRLCELNRSPWDVVPLPALDSPSPRRHHQEIAAEEGRNGCVVGNGVRQGEEQHTPLVTRRKEGELEQLPSVIASVAAPTSPAAPTPKNELSNERIEEQTKRKNWKKNMESKKKKRSTASAKEEEDEQQEEERRTCKKTDGRGWQCKRQAHHPHSLCEYHLAQIRSYYYNNHSNHHHQSSRKSGDAKPKPSAGAGTTGNSLEKKDKKATTKKKTRKRRKVSSDSYYYYSGFGPLWGKRRGGAPVAGREVAATDREEVASDSPDEVRKSDQYDELDCDMDDIADVDDIEDEGDDEDHGMKRRKGRKPVKARSLKSLL